MAFGHTALASPTTVNLGSFSATLDPQTVAAGWYIPNITGGTTLPTDNTFTLAPNRLTVTFGGVNAIIPQAGSASGLPTYGGFELPIALAALNPAITGYLVTVNVVMSDYHRTTYVNFPNGPQVINSLPEMQGIVRAVNQDGSSTDLSGVSLSYYAQGMQDGGTQDTVLTGLIGPGANIAGIYARFSALAQGNYSFPGNFKLAIKSIDIQAIAVPEPSSWALTLVGLAGVVGMVRRRRRPAR